jgi:hypothetical protein
MAAKIVAPKVPARKAPRTTPPPLTLANVVIRWPSGDAQKEVPGEAVVALLGVAERLWGETWPATITDAFDIAERLSALDEFIDAAILTGSGDLGACSLDIIQAQIRLCTARCLEMRPERWTGERYAVVPAPSTAAVVPTAKAVA